MLSNWIVVITISTNSSYNHTSFVVSSAFYMQCDGSNYGEQYIYFLFFIRFMGVIMNAVNYVLGEKCKT